MPRIVNGRVALVALSCVMGSGVLEAQVVLTHRSSCANETAARALARAYVLSLPLFVLPSALAMAPETLQVYVPQHASLFRQNGAAIQCARALSVALLRTSFDIYDPQAGERAGRIAADAGVPEFADGVARDANRGAGEMMLLAIELAWLADVLPPMADGDSGPFDNRLTDIRRMQINAARVVEGQARSDASMWQMYRQTVRTLIQQAMPLNEQIITALAASLSA